MKDPNPVLIIDLGSGYLKCGSPGQSIPTVLPAAYPRDKLQERDPKLLELDPGRRDWTFPLENGLLPNKSTPLIKLCELVFKKLPQLSANRNKLEIMFLIFPTSEPEHITAMTKEVQETLGCLHVDAAIQQVLSWGYSRRKTALVIDVGYSVSFVTPIYRGFLLDEFILPLVTGSFFISVAVSQFLQREAEQFSHKKAQTYLQLAEDKVAIKWIKQSMCFILPRPDEPGEIPYERCHYRQGNAEVFLGHIPWQAPEVLFQPTLLGVGDKGVIDAVVDVLEHVDPTIRKELVSNIVITGGGALIPGLKNRVQTALKEQLPHLSVKVFELEYPHYSAFLGAAKM